ncbi:MarR family transcriptional regulator [Streptomyces sp. SID1034]|uniref:MarR family winged helix-turn-helix transcriptional regulator n=1 Tax=Streptomyces sp. SID1034 TaxID=2690248 RepID=UPI00136F1CA0|nr:MarR family transcriptional regulator [Streptomyces sp. SID1034]MYV91911.1 MarR family transcriptional regulator [Streptomyces sp. SID1034]
MSESIDSGLGSLLSVARQAGRMAELLDLVWEQDRNASPPPYLSVSQLRVLYLTDCENGIRMRALTRLLAASPPSVSRLVDRLQVLGFVERQPCRDSRREVMLRVTRQGREYLARLRERRDHVLLQALETVPGHQRDALAEGLAGLQQALTRHPTLRLLAEDTTPTQHSDPPPRGQPQPSRAAREPGEEASEE